MTQCEAKIYDKRTAGIDWRDRFRQCRKEAAGTVGDVALCSTHAGLLAFNRVIDLCGNREMTIAPDPKFVKAVAP